MLSAPQFVKTEPVEMSRKVQIAAQQQHWMLAHRMMGRKESAEPQLCH